MQLSFGWRPVASCYQGSSKGTQDQPSTPDTVGGQTQLAAVQAPAPCPTATWWYLGLGFAAFAALAKR